MPNVLKRIISGLIMVLTLAALVGCGSAAQPFSHSAYVKAMLDASYKAEFGEYTELTGSTPEEALAQYEANMKMLANDFCGTFSFDFPQENMNKMSGAIEAMLKSASYEVGEAKKVDDGEYTVEITIRPVKNFGALWNGINNFTDDFIERINNSEFDEMERNEIYAVYADEITEIAENEVKEITLEDELVISVAVRRDEQGKWFIPDEDQDNVFRSIIMI